MIAILPERRVSPLAEWARSVSLFSAVLLITSAVGHRYGLVETIAFIWLLLLVAGLALLGLVLAAGGMARLWEHGEKAGKASLVAIVVSLVALAPFGAAAYAIYRYPALSDVSTDLEEPPQFVYAGAERTAMENPIVPISEADAKVQAANYPDLNGRRFEASLQRVVDAVRAVLDARGWTQYPPVPDTRGLTIEVDAPTYWLRFPVDAVIRIIDEGGSTFVDMRMSSHFGRHDLGAGARRIGKFMADLDEEFGRQSLEIIDIPPSTEEEEPVD